MVKGAAKKATKKASSSSNTKKSGKKTAKKAVKKASISRSSKKSVKKTAPKTTVTISKKVLGEAPQEHHFVLKDGRSLKSVQELADAMEHMSDDIFKHHVSPLHNDFANWIGDVFEEQSFAEELRDAHNQIEMRIKLLQKLVDDMIAEGSGARRS